MLSKMNKLYLPTFTYIITAKSGNVTFDRHRQEVILSSFCLGRHLIHDDELLTDQRGSPAYISPGRIHVHCSFVLSCVEAESVRGRVRETF